MRRVSTRRARENYQRGKLTRQRRADVQWCPRCGRPVPATDQHLHEFVSSGQGGSRIEPTNTVLVCDWCNSHFEDYPVHAAWDGWRASGKHPRDPKIPEGHARRLDGVVVPILELAVTP